MKIDTDNINPSEPNQLDLAVLTALIMLYSQGINNDIEQLKKIFDSDFEIKKNLLLNDKEKELSSEAILCLQSDDIVAQIFANINKKIAFFEETIKNISIMKNEASGFDVINQHVNSNKILLQEIMSQQYSSVSQSSLKHGDIDDFMSRK